MKTQFLIEIRNIEDGLVRRLISGGDLPFVPYVGLDIGFPDGNGEFWFETVRRVAILPPENDGWRLVVLFEWDWCRRQWDEAEAVDCAPGFRVVNDHDELDYA